jgi:hypothetical protein
MSEEIAELRAELAALRAKVQEHDDAQLLLHARAELQPQ